MNAKVESRARISHCGQYRYTLTRGPRERYPSKGAALFCMLNPSTADASQDDATIRRCRGFSEEWDCNGFVVVNLYALRATNPRELKRHPDPVGPDNELYLADVAREFDDVVFACGGNADPRRLIDVAKIFQSRGRRLWHLGLTAMGFPKHPLYLKAGTPLAAWHPGEMIGGRYVWSDTP